MTPNSLKRLTAVVLMATGASLGARAQTGGLSLPDSGRISCADTIREISVATGWGSKAETGPRGDGQKDMAGKRPFPVQSFIIPAAMIAYGAVAVHNGTLRHLNGDVKEQG